MTLQELLDQRNISKYKLSKMTGIPKTTIMDICAGRSDIARCSARTVQLLARGLGCTMEEIMDLSEEYMEYGLPGFLRDSINRMKDAWYKVDHNIPYLHWDGDYCELQSEINNAEVNGMISSEQAWYLRHKYLRMEENLEL